MVQPGNEANGSPAGEMRAHVIVCGNEKGGSGKSTTSMHLAIALLKMGHRVATMDLDRRQLTLTRYLENRRAWAADREIGLVCPDHVPFPAEGPGLADTEGESADQALQGAIGAALAAHDFIVIDTPGSDTGLNRAAHRQADTLITPINDSFIDFDVLARIDPVSLQADGISQYAAAVMAARGERRKVTGRIADWVVVRNRLSAISSRNEVKVDTCLRDLARQLDFRVAEGISERVVFREFFPLGLTALDEFETHVLGTVPTLSHLAARQEIRSLVNALNLPLDESGRKRAELRRAYTERGTRPLALPDIFAT